MSGVLVVSLCVSIYQSRQNMLPRLLKAQLYGSHLRVLECKYPGQGNQDYAMGGGL